MPPRTPLPSPSTWRCPQCTVRSFSTTTRQLAVGPEHPRYVEIPEPPQQTVPDSRRLKGVLPIPRNVFAGSPKDLSSDEQIALSTKSPDNAKIYAKGSREEWKAKMAELRKQNLREGLKSLKMRQQRDARQVQARSAAKQADRDERLNRTEREDERLTAPSNNLDLDALFNKCIPDPTREDRIERKRLNIEAAALRKQEARMDALHSLYMNARDFIVTPEQLDKAVDAAFGTPENPVTFGGSPKSDLSFGPGGKSIWELGRPERIQDLLNRANGNTRSRAVDEASGPVEINKQRIKRIAETLTGGQMDSEDRN